MGAVRPDFCPPHVDGQSLRLLQAHVFFRHGDRSPTPAFGNPDLDLWSSRLQEVPPLLPANRQYQQQQHPFGHLTNKGAEQAKALGMWIKNAYLNNLDVQLDKPDSFLRVRSTNYLRTHMSAWFVLEGLLGSAELASSVPICILDDRIENLHHNDHCPRLAKLWRAAWISKRKSQLLPDGTIQELGWSARFEDIRKSFIKHLNLPETTRFPWVLAADIAQCALSHDDPLPESLTEETLSEIRNHLAEDYASTFQDKEICELSMGRLMREVVDSMLQRSSSSPSLYLYSGHDATIVPLSVALGLPWKNWPPYAASIAIELWSSGLDDGHHHHHHQEQQYVRVLYDGSEVALPVDSPGIEFTWQKPTIDSTSSTINSPKTLYTIEQFVALAKWTMLSDAQFQNKCQCDF